MDADVLAQALRTAARKLDEETDRRRAMRTYPPAAVDEDSVRNAIADALALVADELES